ncbi:holin [Collinsella stercoris]|uniref:holin n=1 Tax=Collinsella stercoris TaxID=147206 RepID=UPI003A8DC703
MENIKHWAACACVRALKTAAQTAVGVIGGAAAMGAVDWQLVASAAALSAIVSVLTSVAGIPEVGGGASVPKMMKEG